MGEVVAREVEMVSNPSVPVVGHGAPVLGTSLSARSCVAHLPHILRRFPLAGSRPMRTGDGVADIGVSQVMFCLIGQVWPVKVLVIPYICHFFYTGKIFGE